MNYSFPLYSLFLFGGGVIAFVLASIIWKRRPAPGILPLFIFLSLVSAWLITAGFQAGALDIPVKLFWTKIQYIGQAVIGIIWLYFVADYTGSKKLLRRSVFIPITILPVTMLILAWTNEYHSLIWTDIMFISGPLGNTSKWVGGPFFLVNPVYQYILLIWGMVILCRFASHKSRIYRVQLLHFILANSVPIVGSILYALNINPAPNFDITPIYLLIAALLYSVAVLRFHFMDVLPVAYRTLVKSIPDSMLVLDSFDNILDLNPAAEQIFRKKRSDLLDQPLSEIYPDLYELSSLSREINHLEMRRATPESTQFFNISLVPLIDSRKSARGKLIVMRNITELKHALSAEKTLSADLEQEIKKRSKYTHAIVHELRSPLTAVKLSGELLADQVKDHVQISLVKNILRATLNLDQRINELFELARGESGLIKIKPEPLDLAKLIRDVVEEMKPGASALNIALDAEFHNHSINVMGDKSRIRQILTNLIGNSLKFTEKGSITVSTAPHDEDFLFIGVTDTGCGMDHEQVCTLFDPYSRKQTSGGETTGLGIGLTLSKMFVELHGGEIKAESSPGHGTIISFTLPYAR